ncbi:CDP-alcohol phosphatidyltransferase family protein [Myxococcota bacterium]|nr:CDP-alcohol phosphatidyltransferase family protein [Myxococcota bacterium]MBU1534467.1 CDP-alcohol phosphatidyltransferase family protein [Myxococcota bacterium]
MHSQSNAKYWIPNLMTLTSLMLAVTAIMLAFNGSLTSAIWLAFLCMCLDRLDGIVARKLGATSNFGMELDSLADLVAFGVTPAVMLFIVTSTFSPHFNGNYKYIPMAVSAFWVYASALRLAKFNIIDQSGRFAQVFQGFPMPIAAGFILSPMLVLMKYFPVSGYGVKVYDPRLASVLSPSKGFHQHWGFTVLVVWAAFVAWTMISPIRVPKFGKPKIRWRRYYMAATLLMAYVLILGRAFPEWIAFTGFQFFVVSMYFHFTASKEDRGEYFPITEVMSWKLVSRQEDKE